MTKINELRKKIDVIDEQLIELIYERITCSIDIGKIKAENGMDIYDPLREKEIFEKGSQIINKLLQNKHMCTEKSMYNAVIKSIYEEILKESKKTQECKWD